LVVLLMKALPLLVITLALCPRGTCGDAGADADADAGAGAGVEADAEASVGAGAGCRPFLFHTFDTGRNRWSVERPCQQHRTTPRCDAGRKRRRCERREVVRRNAVWWEQSRLFDGTVAV